MKLIITMGTTIYRDIDFIPVGLNKAKKYNASKIVRNVKP